MLGVRCIDGAVDVLMIGREYLGDSVAGVDWRFDRRAAESADWESTPAGTGVFAPAPAYFARQIIGGSALVIDTYDFREVRYRYTFSLAGSGAAVSRVLTECGLPITDPRVTDPAIWRRVIDDIERLDPVQLREFQGLLVKLNTPGVAVTGNHDLATYSAASKLWVEFWAECRLNRHLSGSCFLWNPDDNARYPVEVVDLVEELNRDAILIARNRADFAKVPDFIPERRPAPVASEWSFAPNGDDLGHMAPKSRTSEGRATINCDVNQWGGLRDCNVVVESPAGQGFGEAAVSAASLYSSRGSTGGRLTLEIVFPPPVAVVRSGE